MLTIRVLSRCTSITQRQAVRSIGSPLKPIRFSLVRHLSAPLNKPIPKSRPKSDLEIHLEEPIKLPEPVPQEKLKRIPVEYHGIGPSNFKDEETIWYPIYRFPYILGLHAFIRFKVWLTGLTISLCLYRVYTFVTGEADNLILAMGGSLFTLISLTLFGVLFRKLVVQIYASNDGAFIRFCRFTFFGKRLDMVLPRDCVVPLSETNRTMRNKLFNIKYARPEKMDFSYDNHEFYDETFRMIMSMGGVVDRKRFEMALGKILSRKYD